MVNGKPSRKPYYALTYRYSWDYDDDSPSGVGNHSTNWSTSTVALKARTDKGALREARAWLKVQRINSRNSSYGLVKVEHVVPEQRREIPLR